MKKGNLNPSELKVMNILWDSNPLEAREVTGIANQLYGWNKNTTYTILKGLVQKEAVQRNDPNFVCIPLLSRDDVCQQETQSLIDRLYKGSAKLFFSSFLKREDLSDSQIEEIQSIIDGKRKQ